LEDNAYHLFVFAWAGTTFVNGKTEGAEWEYAA
jgi:hypothetical protein